MSVTDPDVPDPLNDPRTTQADPGALGQGADLASAGDDPAATGEDELDADRVGADDDPAGGVLPDDDLTGGDVTGGAITDLPPA
ncbi:hypothetical protein OF117_12365 [Geodermatophilus sp. YIM 151500]|uniref:hypothetical protein n=1 Tax=Geodermatophilus sp. YIM 151500 TaxID=2984531 RepID=UPI0021E4FF4C|nr:hypothetical protein [Geodermatophilus sp. YIM 151500]MCV2490158.1 hypothetical protein [Geodermatophilus sp. YIM 151500]